MEELLIFIRSLLVNDPILLAAYVAAGSTSVSVLTPRQRTVASYPRIILEGHEGEQVSFSENSRPKFTNGTVRLEIVTRKSDSDPLPLQTLYAIQEQVTELLLGNPVTGVPGIKGQQVGSKYNVPIFKQCNPSGLVPPLTDTTVERWRGTYDCQLNRMAF